MPSETKRLFIAVPLPKEQRTTAAALCDRIRPLVPFHKWVDPRDYHITLQFLGDTETDRIEIVASVLAGAVRSIEPFRLALTAPGVFGARQSPSVLWLGAAGEIAALETLQRAVAAAMQPIGFEPEARPYRPHVTLARRYAGSSPFLPEKLAQAARHDAAEAASAWTVHDVALFESRLGRLPMYEAIASCPLSRRQ